MFGWKEVFVGSSKENFEHVKQNLDKGEIEYRVKVKGGNSQVQKDSLGERPVSGSYYYIYVKKQDEEHAKQISK